MIDRGRSRVGDGGGGGSQWWRRKVVMVVVGKRGRRRRRLIRRRGKRVGRKVEKGGRVHGNGGGILVISQSFDFSILKERESGRLDPEEGDDEVMKMKGLGDELDG